MSVQELKSAVTQLSPAEAEEFARWYAEFERNAWAQREPQRSRIQRSLEELNERGVQETNLDMLELEMKRRGAA
jgi:hypothetical protein